MYPPVDPRAPPVVPPQEADYNQILAERERERAQLEAIYGDQYKAEDLNFARNMIKTSDLPKAAKDKLYGLFDQTTVLTWFTDLDIRIICRMADIVFNLILNSMPPELKTPMLLQEIEQLKMLHFKMVLRSRGGFERKEHQTSTRYTHISGEKAGEEKKQSIPGRILGFGGNR